MAEYDIAPFMARYEIAKLPHACIVSVWINGFKLDP